MANRLRKVSPTTASHTEPLRGAGVAETLVRGASGAFWVNAIGVGIAFVEHVLLARLLGVKDYGIFVYAITWMNVVSIVSILGFNNATLRFVGEYNGTKQWGLLRGFLKSSNRYVEIASITAAAVMTLVIWFARARLGYETAIVFWLMCLVLPFRAMLLIRAAALRAFKRIVEAQVPQAIVRPIIMIAVVTGFFFTAREWLSATTAMVVNLAAFVGTFIMLDFFLKRVIPEHVKEAEPEYKREYWLTVAAPMFAITVLMQTQNQIDVLLIGLLLETDEVGMYAVAKKTTSLIGFGLLAANMIAAPMISELWHQGRKKELQRMLTLAARGIFAFTLPVGVLMIVFGKEILALFGPQFSDAYWPLVILAGSQLVNALAGPVGFVMLMTGHQGNASRIVAVSLLINVALSLNLIPAYGLIGAAISMAASLMSWNLLMCVYVFRKLKINTTIARLRYEYGVCGSKASRSRC
jgi:O-antigen/teichoic acid export membrane protein